MGWVYSIKRINFISPNTAEVGEMVYRGRDDVSWGEGRGIMECIVGVR